MAITQSSSITLLNTMEWAKKLNFGRRSALGDFLEPALTSANTVLQTIVGAPFSWRWNRVVTGFVTTPGQQDYTLINWANAQQVQTGWLTVDDAGNSQSVSTAGSTGATAPAWNHVKGATTQDGNVIWTNLGPIGLPVSQGYRFGWIETASVQDPGNSKWVEIENQLCLASDSSKARPKFISAQGDDGQGNITFRLMPVPEAAYTVAVTIQQKAPLFLGTNQTWAPVPDEFSHIYNWGFLSMMWLFSDDPRFGIANQKFVAHLLSASEGLDETERNIFLHNWQLVTGQPASDSNRMTQGTQARGV